jgi:hypothetical protein
MERETGRMRERREGEERGEREVLTEYIKNCKGAQTLNRVLIKD